MKKLLFVAMIFVVGLAACDKSKKDPMGNRYKMLVSSKWQITSQEINGANAAIPDCEKDNYFVFEESGNGRWEEGANNCFGNVVDTTTPPPPPVDTTTPPSKEGDVVKTFTEFTWSITGDQREIHIHDFGVKGAHRDWTIEFMDYSTFDARVTEHVNGKLKIYNLHMVAR